MKCLLIVLVVGRVGLSIDNIIPSVSPAIIRRLGVSFISEGRWVEIFLIGFSQDRSEPEMIVVILRNRVGVYISWFSQVEVHEVVWEGERVIIVERRIE